MLTPSQLLDRRRVANQKVCSSATYTPPPAGSNRRAAVLQCIPWKIVLVGADIIRPLLAIHDAGYHLNFGVSIRADDIRPYIQNLRVEVIRPSVWKRHSRAQG